jgi:hypothetical protein
MGVCASCRKAGLPCPEKLDGETAGKLMSKVVSLTCLAILVGSGLTFGVNAAAMAKLADCEGCGDQHVFVLQSLGSFAIHFFFIVMGCAIASAECNAILVAKYLGFLAFRLGRGLSLLCIGLVMLSYSSALMQALVTSGQAVAGSDVFVAVCGWAAAVVGLGVLLISLFPYSCGIPEDELTTRFRTIHKDARTARKEASNYGAGAGGASADLEAGGKAKGKKGKDKSSAYLQAEPSVPTLTVAGSGGGGGATDNPFLSGAKGADNPFMSGGGGCASGSGGRY